MLFSCASRSPRLWLTTDSSVPAQRTAKSCDSSCECGPETHFASPPMMSSASRSRAPLPPSSGLRSYYWPYPLNSALPRTGGYNSLLSTYTRCFRASDRQCSFPPPAVTSSPRHATPRRFTAPATPYPWRVASNHRFVASNTASAPATSALSRIAQLPLNNTDVRP